jgi:2-polyprenyl-6-methoxyphenol hydroxylase-like FAD-dependent oxidoreductase
LGSTQHTIAVVGAGIGGLSAAIALRARGFDVDVYEQAPVPLEVGAGLHLWANAVRALDEIGLGDLAGALGVAIEHETIHLASGRRIATWDVASAERDAGHPSVGLSRPELLAALVEAAGRERLHTGRRLESLAEDAEGVTLRFAGGETARAALVVGADGLRSTVRAHLHGAAEPRYAGYTSWRTLIPAGLAPAPADAVAQYWGRGVRFVHFPAGRDGRIYLVCLANAAAGGRDESAAAAKERLRELARAFPQSLRDLVEAVDPERLVRTDIADRDPLRQWGRGRVTLLGDAAHPMTPNTSQGAGMALEDAAVLARELAAHGPTEAALRAYEHRRQKRTAMQIRIARFNGNLGRARSPVAVAARDALISVLFPRLAWQGLRRVLVEPV